mmetsp:Transcript_37418/g.6717  ORF Transcript_37418/g.6717 Transcript_37418/m.6717 type:complete len:87 (+) Transcript_37418:325-585(+)
MVAGGIMIGPWLIPDAYEISYIGALIFLGGLCIILVQIIPRLIKIYNVTYDEHYDADKAALSVLIYMLLTPIGIIGAEVFIYFGRW